MASGGSPYDEYKAKNSDYKPKSNRRPPRYGTSFEAEMSLNSELQRSLSEERSSLPNNLTWTGGEGSKGKKSARSRGSPGDQYSDDAPTRFTRKKHTPATLPRTKFSSTASGEAQHRAMDKLKQHLMFTSEDEMQRGEEQQSRQASTVGVPVNNERNLRQQTTSSRGTPSRNQESGSGVNSLQLPNSTNSSNSPADSSRVLDRLKQVRGYLRQATSLYITLSSKSTSPDEATDEDLEQLDKLAKLIKDLKAQEKTYVDFVQRSIAAHRESSIDNTPSTSVVSLDGETQNDAASEQSEDLEGLRQQHALLRQMVEQQKQLKQLQERQNALLDLQRRAEGQLKEAEAEGKRITSLMNGQTVDPGSVRGRSRSGTERSDDSHSSQPGAVGGAGNVRGSSASGFRYTSREQAQPNRKPANDQKPENIKNRRLPSSEQAALVPESTGSLTPDNEAQALAAADAAQERLELESKLMDLQAKKEQMDALVAQLQQLREMQLGKEMALSQERSVNETIENGDDDVPLATRSAKDTGDNVDDEKILEALQLHRKLRKLQDVKDKLERLKELFEEQQEPSAAESDVLTRMNGPHQTQQSRESQGAESRASGANPDDGATSDDIPPGSIDWILNSGIDDPELLARLRQVKAAKERVANLKHRNEQNNVAQPYSRTEGASGLAQAVSAPDEDSTVQTDNETTGSVSSSLMWQEDPEFQEKLRKLNAARKKLKKLQELVKKTEELPVGPSGKPYLPAEIMEMSFSTDEDEDDDDEDNEERSAAEDGDRGGHDANGEGESEEDATSETLVQDETTHARGQQDDGYAYGDSELGYMDKLTEQRAALSHLLAEKQKLLETQEHLKRLRQNDAVTQTRQSEKHKPLETFIHNATEASTSRQDATADSATQTLNSEQRPTYPQPGIAASNSLLWRELRRQRELQEQKLKKRKERLMLERKGRRSGLENGSEDEGFGRSTLSADITTATWGGSTQMSSTQNDSAVSEGSSRESDEEILVEVEDDASDGIVQAEEEEEENSEVDIFPTTSTANRKQMRKSASKQNAREKRLLFEGLRKQDLERHERFKGWQNSLFPSGNKKTAKKPQRFSNPEQLTAEESYNARERSMWERQFNVLQGQLENTTSLCNTLLRDQQTLISVLLNRGETPQPTATFGPHSFNQYQQRQQEALQGIQNYFEQQRFLVQQQQMLQNLTECYSQMQQQHEDMLHLQQSFTQLFTHPAAAEQTPSTRPSATPNAPTSTLGSTRTSNSFSFQPSHSFAYRPETIVRETPPPSPFTSAQAKPSVERHVGASASSTSQQPSSFVSFPWVPHGLRNRQFQFVGSTNPDTGVPSPEASSRHAHNPVTTSAQVKPVLARVVSATNTSPGNSPLAYNPVTYSEPNVSASNNVVVGKQFPTPQRATAAAQLAGQDKSNWRGVKRRREEDKVETDSISSHQSSLPGDSEKPGTESDAQSDYSLFEALRDSIYAEVATLISQNESRPHFLIELFRELQLLGSDYLRQRALYSLRDLVTRFLKDDPPGGTIESAMGAYSWLASASEQTPSESAGFSETDQDQDKMKEPEVSTQGIYDYVEAVESGSTLSTPNSTNHEPFASEYLGETVIHLDKALKSMRERDRRESEGSSTRGNEGATAAVVQGGEEPTSSAGDVASESSLPDIQYPKIDTQALDRQIKKIMAEVIPCLNDHMEETCSVELLEYMRKMVMGMIQTKNEAKEFSRFFHKQLESILQDSLAKFIGKRMKDCGEDLLVDISEILFNELAFYKLMQELDGGTKAKFFNREQKYRMENVEARNSPTQSQADNTVETSRDTAEVKVDDNEVVVENENAEDQEDEGSSSSSEWQVVDETPEDKPQDETMMSREQLEQDEENLGRDRDDAMAEEFDEPRDHSEATATESSQFVNVVELSMSESRPLASNGSDEEESEVEVEGPGDVNDDEENAEGAVWNGSMNGGQAAQRNMLSSQMAAANGGTGLEEEECASSSNQNKQEEDQDDDLPTKFTGLTEADLQVKIAEEQSRNDGIHGIVASMNDGSELAGDPNVVPEPEGSALVNGDVHETEN